MWHGEVDGKCSAFCFACFSSIFHPSEQCQLPQPVKFPIYQWTVQKARRWPLESLIRHQHPPSQHWPLNKISFEGILPNATFWGLKCGLICAQLQTSTNMLSFNISNICLNPTTSNNFTMSNFFLDCPHLYWWPHKSLISQLVIKMGIWEINSTGTNTANGQELQIHCWLLADMTKSLQFR